MSERLPPPVSLSHPLVGRTVFRDGKAWKVASIRMNDSKPWAWLVNRRNPQEQVRLPLAALGSDC